MNILMTHPIIAVLSLGWGLPSGLSCHRGPGIADTTTTAIKFPIKIHVPYYQEVIVTITIAKYSKASQ